MIKTPNPVDRETETYLCDVLLNLRVSFWLSPMVSFEIDPFRKKCLLEGLDDIGLTLEKADNIDSFEAQRDKDQPWL